MLQDSDSWLDLLQEGLALARAGEFDEALDHFERARELAPTRPETACALGREHMRRGQLEEALELLEEAWNQDRSLITAGTSLARCLGLDLEQFGKAHSVLDDVDARYANEPTSRLIRAEVLLAEGRHEEAAVVSEALLESPSQRIVQSATLLMSRVENERDCEQLPQAASSAPSSPSNVRATSTRAGRHHRATLGRPSKTRQASARRGVVSTRARMRSRICPRLA